MRVDLRTLQNNPMRDFTVDPIDCEAVEKLRQSIRSHGFWGGIVCRRLSNGTVQIGAGHHRVEAALAEGIIEADVAVYDDRDDAWMVQVYVGENATQRGNNSTAEAGSVAAAIRCLGKVIIVGGCQQLLTSSELPELRGNLTSKRGLGESTIEEFLVNVPGIQKRTLREHLANLKASGDYARIVKTVADEVIRETSDVDTGKTAQIVAEQTEEHFGRVIFDFAGVAQHLRISHQIEVFRKIVTSKALQEVLPLSYQAPLAAQLKHTAKTRNDAELSGAFISNNIMAQLMEARQAIGQWSKRQEEEAMQHDRHRRVRAYEDELVRGFRLMMNRGEALRTLKKEWPNGIPFPLRPAFQ